MATKLSRVVAILLPLAGSFLFAAMAQAATLAAPANANAVPYSEGQIVISWRDKSTNESGFEIVRSRTGPYGTYSLIASTGANVTSFNDTAVNASTQYCYKVRAFNSGRYSDFSYNIGASRTSATDRTVKRARPRGVVQPDRCLLAG